MEKYDIAIVGTGPAGLSASITASIRNKKILLFGTKNLSNKIRVAREIKNYLGIPEITGSDLANRYKEHIDRLGIEIIEKKITAIYSMGDYFIVQSDKLDFYAKSVILATGVALEKKFEGEEENLGSGVSYCATCDAGLYKGLEAIVLSYSKEEEGEINFLAERAKKIYLLPFYKDIGCFRSNVEVITKEIPTKIIKEDSKINLQTKNGQYTADGIFILREAVSSDRLVPGIKMQDGHIEVDRKMKTNIEGLFACGDVIGRPYQYIKAAGEGNVAALSAVSYIDKLHS